MRTHVKLGVVSHTFNLSLGEVDRWISEAASSQPDLLMTLGTVKVPIKREVYGS